MLAFSGYKVPTLHLQNTKLHSSNFGLQVWNDITHMYIYGTTHHKYWFTNLQLHGCNVRILTPLAFHKMWLFRVGKISLRICEYTQWIKWRNCSQYYIKTRSVWCFWFSTTMKGALLCTVIMLHHADLFPKRNSNHGVIRSDSRKKSFSCSYLLISCLVHVIKRISNEFSFHTMYYEIRCERLGDIKQTTRFIIHRMEWKFVWDSICSIRFINVNVKHSGSIPRNACVACET